MTPLQRYSRLERKLKQAQSEKDHAQGAYDQHLATLKEQLGTDDLEQAERIVRKRKYLAEEAEQLFQQKLDEYEQRYSKS